MPTPKKKAPVKKAAVPRGRAEYPVEKVDELAEPLPPRGNKAQYLTLLGPLMEDPGQRYLVGVYTSTGGAARVKRQIQAGKTLVPGEVGDWDFETVRTNIAPNTPGSHLYATYRASR